MKQIMDSADDRMEVPVSQISVSENDAVTILSGPLKNVEGQLRKSIFTEELRRLRLIL